MGISRVADGAPGGLAHSLMPRHVAMISLGGIIGAGLFVGSSAAIAMAGPAVLISYALSGMLIFLIMRMLGEMAVARPGVGSFAEYTALGLGHWAGFATGWLYWYFWVITVGVETIAGAGLLQQWIALPAWLIGFVLIAVMTVTNLFSVRAYAEFEFWFASLKVGAIAAFVLIGLAYIFGFGTGPGVALQVVTSHGGIFPEGIGAAFSAIPVVIFSMMGSEVATIAAAETEAPAENVARAGRTVSLRILIFYVASMAVIVSVLPWDSVVPGSSPFTKALQAMHIPGAALVMSLVAVTAVLSCLNSGLYITSRMLFELARRGDAPAIFAATSASRVPSLGILFGTAAGVSRSPGLDHFAWRGVPVPRGHLGGDHPVHLHGGRVRRNPAARTAAGAGRGAVAAHVVFSPGSATPSSPEFSSCWPAWPSHPDRGCNSCSACSALR